MSDLLFILAISWIALSIPAIVIVMALIRIGGRDDEH